MRIEVDLGVDADGRFHGQVLTGDGSVCFVGLLEMVAVLERLVAADHAAGVDESR